MSMSATNIPELDSLRIARRPAPKSGPKRRYGMMFVGFLTALALAAISYAFYVRRIGRPSPVETFVVDSTLRQRPSVLLTSSG